MFTAQEAEQIHQLRWKHESQLETHIKPVQDGYVISTVERFIDEAGIIVAQATFTKVSHNGVDVADYIFNLYAIEAKRDETPTVPTPAVVPETERYTDEDQIG